MASPIAHTLAGVMVYRWRSSRRPSPPKSGSRKDWGHLARYVFLANVCDFDFVVSWLMSGHPNTYHHGLSHGLPLVAAGAAITALARKEDGGFWDGWQFDFLAIGSHPLIDLFTGKELGFHATSGVALLAPFTDTLFKSPLTLFLGPAHTDWSDIFAARNWLLGVYDFALLGPITAGVYVFTMPRIPNDRVSPKPSGCPKNAK